MMILRCWRIIGKKPFPFFLNFQKLIVVTKKEIIQLRYIIQKTIVLNCFLFISLERIKEFSLIKFLFLVLKIFKIFSLNFLAFNPIKINGTIPTSVKIEYLPPINFLCSIKCRLFFLLIQIIYYFFQK